MIKKLRALKSKKKKKTKEASSTAKEKVDKDSVKTKSGKGSKSTDTSNAEASNTCTVGSEYEWATVKVPNSPTVIPDTNPDSIDQAAGSSNLLPTSGYPSVSTSNPSHPKLSLQQWMRERDNQMPLSVEDLPVIARRRRRRSRSIRNRVKRNRTPLPCFKNSNIPKSTYAETQRKIKAMTQRSGLTILKPSKKVRPLKKISEKSNSPMKVIKYTHSYSAKKTPKETPKETPKKTPKKTPKTTPKDSSIPLGGSPEHKKDSIEGNLGSAEASGSSPKLCSTQVLGSPAIGSNTTNLHIAIAPSSTETVNSDHSSKASKEEIVEYDENPDASSTPTELLLDEGRSSSVYYLPATAVDIPEEDPDEITFFTSRASRHRIQRREQLMNNKQKRTSIIIAIILLAVFFICLSVPFIINQL
ncbi:WASH complex subunit 2-like [Trichogramma pretiosum]|uniref:WASH complex subunit 2-like n=1 Tax=Trichogramma pretiosum TaxID=7493 RepID=UPI0006C9D61E|nr:WASH complex subunit 2-like [Trichogramma pretiosum]